MDANTQPPQAPAPDLDDAMDGFPDPPLAGNPLPWAPTRTPQHQSYANALKRKADLSEEEEEGADDGVLPPPS